MKLTPDSITDDQIRALRARLGSETYAGASDDAVACEVAIAAPLGSLRRIEARARCAELLSDRAELLSARDAAPTPVPKVTDAQAALLTRALAGSEAGIHIYGGEVRAARALEKLGLLTLVDDGEAPMGGNRDGERWSIEKVDRTRAAQIISDRSRT